MECDLCEAFKPLHPVTACNCFVFVIVTVCGECARLQPMQHYVMLSAFPLVSSQMLTATNGVGVSRGAFHWAALAVTAKLPTTAGAAYIRIGILSSGPLGTVPSKLCRLLNKVCGTTRCLHSLCHTPWQGIFGAVISNDMGNDSFAMSTECKSFMADGRAEL